MRGYINAPIVSWDGGYVFGAALSLEELCSQATGATEPRGLNTLSALKALNVLDTRVTAAKAAMSSAATAVSSPRKGSENRSGSGRSSRKEAGIPGDARVIVSDNKVVVYSRGEAIVVQERYVRLKKIKKAIIVRSRGEVRKESVTLTVEEKPATIMVPEAFRDDIVSYLMSLSPRDRRVKAVVKAAIRLLSSKPREYDTGKETAKASVLA